MPGRRGLIAIGIASAFLLCGRVDSAALDERSKKVDELFSPWNTPDTPGAVVAVIQDETILYQKAYGRADLERDVPLSTRSVFDIASISKQFVAMSILLLEEQAKLSLDDDIRSYLPDFPDYGKTITIRHMIHHTSGIRDYMDLMELAGMRWENSYDPSEIIDLVRRQEALNNDPGDQYLYSNSGYLLLAEIIHKVSGQSLGEFTRRHIFEPLHMKVSHFYDDFTRIVKDRALSYSRKKTGGYKSVQYIFDVVGDTGLLTNIEDLSLWDRNFYHNQLGLGGQKLIEHMLVPGQLNSGEKLDYAFGLELEKYRGLLVVRHSGGAAGYDTEMMRFPDQKLTVIVLANLAEFPSTRMAEQVADLYLADQFTAGKETRETERSTNVRARVELDIAEKDIEGYTGQYYSDELDATYFVRFVEGDLTYHLEYSPVDVRLVPTGPDEWRARRIEMRFLRGRNDRVNGLDVSFGPIRNIHFQKIPS